MPQLVDAFRIQALRRFVEQHQLRLGQERLREGQPLAHPVAVHPHGIMDALFQPDKADRFLDLRRW